MPYLDICIMLSLVTTVQVTHTKNEKCYWSFTHFLDFFDKMFAVNDLF